MLVTKSYTCACIYIGYLEEEKNRKIVFLAFFFYFSQALHMKYGKKNIFEVDFLIFQNESNNDAYVQPIVEGRCSFSFSNRNNLNDKVSIVF